MTMMIDSKEELVMDLLSHSVDNDNESDDNDVIIVINNHTF